MLIKNVLVIDVKRSNLKLRRVIQAESRRKMIMTEPMIRIQFNNMLYGSDAGAEMAATYHSVIGTVKLHGSSVWNFIGTFFKNIFKSLWLLANVKFKTN